MDTIKVSAMRDPAGNAEAYKNFLGGTFFHTQEEFAAFPLQSRVAWSQTTFGKLPRYLVHLYGGGGSLADIKASVLSISEILVESKKYLLEHADAPIRDEYPLMGNERRYVGFAAISLLLINEANYLETFKKLVPPSGDGRAYLFDVLIKSFIPDYPLLKKYKPNKFATPWSEPVLRALAGPPEQRAEALAAHMKNWCRLMRPWGWKPDLDTTVGKDNLFCDFAFEVALAVCAYDIDDGSFRDHPYYPRDLVDAYRANVRNARDAWRPVGAGRRRAGNGPTATAQGRSGQVQAQERGALGGTGVRR